MDYTKNQIYKYAKYLDKYTKNSNKNGSIYLQKLNKYSHNAQHGGAGELDELVQQIQESVTLVIETDTRTTADLIETINRFTDITVTVQDYQEKFTLTSKKQEEIADLACKIAGILGDECKDAVTDGAVDGKRYVTYWTKDGLYGDLSAVPYFQSNFLNCIKIIKALLQMKLIALMLTTEKIENKDNIIATCIDEIKSLEAIIKYLSPIENINTLFTTNKFPEELTLKSITEFVEERKASVPAPSQQPSSPVSAPAQQPPTPAPAPAQQPPVPAPVQQPSTSVQQPPAPTSVQQPPSPVHAPEESSSLDSVTTKQFDVLGYTDEKGQVTRYTFPTNTSGNDKVLNDSTIRSILPQSFSTKLKMLNHPLITVSPEQSFKLNKDSTTCRIVLRDEVPIRQFAQLFINKPINIQGIRLYVRPVTYPPRGQLDEKQQQINKLGTEIDAKIKEKEEVSTQPSAQDVTASSARARGGPSVTVRPASAQVSLDPANPTTKKFDIIGFTINIDGRPTRYEIPQDQKEKVLELLPQKLGDERDTELPIELMPRDKNTNARVTFSNPLLIEHTLHTVNKEVPKNVSFTTPQGNPITVYLFIVPMTYPIDERTNPEQRPYYQAINEIAQKEMDKINKAMEAQAEKRKSAQLESAQRRPPLQQSQASAPLQQSQAQASAPSRGRGGRGGPGSRASNGGYRSLSTRGPYHHPNKEYNL